MTAQQADSRAHISNHCTIQFPAERVADSSPLLHCLRNLALGNGTGIGMISFTCSGHGQPEGKCGGWKEGLASATCSLSDLDKLRVLSEPWFYLSSDEEKHINL